MTTLTEGKAAPAFSLPASDGTTVSLKDFKGKKNVVLYFYPKDDTPGCTVEACGFRDSFKSIENLDAVVLGVSPDPVKKHEKFIKKYGIPFRLLSDESKATLEKYGVWVEKNMYGRKYMGVARTTVIIGKDGLIKKVFAKVSPKGHDREVLEELTKV